MYSVVLVVKNSPANEGDAGDKASMPGQGIDLHGVRKVPWRRAWQPTSGFLPGQSH